jgi:uncharacterized Rossmann fold enzyme
MNFEEWEPYYQEILIEFSFKREEDELSASVLSELLAGKKLASQVELKALIQGRDVVVVGGGNNLEDELNRDISQSTVIAADGTTSVLLDKGLNPHIIVTDLDGNIEDQISANNNGSIAAIHAHGDNIEQIKKWTPRFEGKIIGTVQCRPFDSLNNYGGFTDGDRGVFLAQHFGAARIHLIGFDFENVGEKPDCDVEIKLRKLGWAKKLIKLLGI